MVARFMLLAALLLYIAAAPHYCSVHADWDRTVRTDYALFRPWAVVCNSWLGWPFTSWTEMFQPPQTGGQVPDSWLPSAWTIPTENTLQAARTLGGPPIPEPSKGPFG